MKCKICNKKLFFIKKIPYSFRGSKIYICNNCSLLQTIYSNTYVQNKDPHSTKFKGERLITISNGTRWGNVRHGKELRLNAHLKFINDIFLNENIKSVFDDGANRGSFAKYCKKKKIYYAGSEPDLNCFPNYKNLNLNIHNLKTENFKTKKKFDLIYSAHTLEHVDNLKKHLKKLNSLMKDDGIFFLEIPNTNQIFYKDKIYEEYFIDKHLYHFNPQTISSILENFSFFTEKIFSNQFNIILILRKKKISLFKKKNIFYKKVINQYYINKERNSKIIKKISKKINFLKKNRKVIFFGAGRILNTFFENGLNTNNLIFLIDNYLSGKIKENHNLEIYNSEYLLKKKINKNYLIFIFARDAENDIFKFLKQKNLHLLLRYRNFIKVN